MKPTLIEEKTKLLCYIDGWEQLTEGYFHPDNPIGQTPPDYLEHGNIQRVIRKACVDQSTKVRFLNSLREIVGQDKPKNKSGHAIVSDYDLITAAPAQLCDAVIQAVNR